jgi:hypothetical protein
MRRCPSQEDWAVAFATKNGHAGSFLELMGLADCFLASLMSLWIDARDEFMRLIDLLLVIHALVSSVNEP